MAAVDIWLTSGHRPTIERVDGGGLRDTDVRPVCCCGWRGPAYGAYDRAVAIVGARAHVQQAQRKKVPPLRPFHLVLVTAGSGRADPADRLRGCEVEVPSGRLEEWSDPWLAP